MGRRFRARLYPRRRGLRTLAPALVRVALALAGLLASVPAGAQPWQITIVRNGTLDDGVPMRYQPLDEPALDDLGTREALQQVVAGRPREFDQILALKDWVAAQFPHSLPDPYPPWDARIILDWIRAGVTGGFCAQYSQVFLQSAAYLGLTARYVEIGATDNPYAHFPVEIWSNDFDKWVLMDMDYNLHFERDGIPLSALEVHDALVGGQAASLTPRLGLVRSGHPSPSAYPLRTVELYYYLRVLLKADHLTARDENPFDRWGDTIEWTDDLTVPWESSAVPSIFPKVRLTEVTTASRARLYPRLNQVVVHATQAGPDAFDVSIAGNDRAFDHYEVATKWTTPVWTRVSGAVYRWMPGDSDNVLMVRSVNTRGRPGPPSILRATRYGISADRYGVVHADGGTLPAATVGYVRDAGLGWVQYDLFWSVANPSPGVYDWTRFDADIDRLRGAGLSVYVRVLFPPTWTTGASYPNAQAPYFCYDPSQPGGLRVHQDCQLSDRIPSVSAVDTFVRAAVRHFSGRVSTWGFGAEVHSGIYWQGTPETFVHNMVAPAYRAAKATNPSVTVVGPDEDDVASLARLLALEATEGRWCDVISFHILRQFSTNVAARLDGELKPVIDRYGGGRAVWLTAAGPAARGDCTQATASSAWLVDRLIDTIARPWITKIFMGSLRDTTLAPYGLGLIAGDNWPQAPYYAVRSLTVADPAARDFLTEGATGPFFDLELALANPTCTDVVGTLTFLAPDGSTRNREIALAARSRTSLRVNDVPGLADSAVSTVVTSPQGVPLIVERTMRWNRDHYGGHGSEAVSGPRTTWYFAEGSQGFFDTYLLLSNPGPVASNVTVQFLLEAGTPVTRTYLVAPTSRFNVFTGAEPSLRNTSFSMVVRADQPITAERAMYFGASRLWDGGHSSPGVPAPASRWYLAEGATGPFFDTYVLVANPNDTAARVTLLFLLDSGETITKVHDLAARSRLTVDLEREDPRLLNAAVSTVVSATVPVVAERSMYWPGSFTQWYEGHNSTGVTESAMKWGLAEGRAGGPEGFETYILLANPAAVDSRVRITFLRDGGGTVTREYVVPATTRLNVYANDIAALANSGFGTLIEVIGGGPIAVERSLYWNAFGQAWAGGTNVTAVKLQ